MTVTELTATVAEYRRAGYADEKIREELQQAGCDDATIDSVLSEVVAEVSLPSATALFTLGFSFAKANLNLLLLLTIPYAVLAVTNFWLVVQVAPEATRDLVLSVVAIGAFFTYFILSLTVLYRLMNTPDAETLTDAFAWVKVNIWSFLWLGLLTTLVTMGGFLLLVIPGIIVSVYLYLAQYVFVAEGKTGMAAVLRSRELVRGYWLAVFSRLLLIGIMLFGSMLLLGVLISTVLLFVPAGPTTDLVKELCMQLASAGIALMMFRVGKEVYKGLVREVPAGQETTFISVRQRYLALAAAGGVAVLIVLAVAHTQSNLPVSPAEDSADSVPAKERAAQLRAQ